jgi:hypothetical protein
VIVTPDTNSLTFYIFTTYNIKYFIVSPIDELTLLVLEYLEPSRVSAPDLHVVGFTSVLDIPRLIIVSSSDGQRLLVEVPDLSSSTVWSLNHKVSVVDQIKVSVTI